MKVNAILGETQELGVEKALLSTGFLPSNEIADSPAQARGPLLIWFPVWGLLVLLQAWSMAGLD